MKILKIGSLMTGLALLAVLSFSACKNKAASKVYKDLQSLSLSQYDINWELDAPRTAVVKVDTMILLQLVEVKDPQQSYHINVTAADALVGSTPGSLKAERLEEVRARQEFSKIIKDEDSGFVYEVKWGENKFSYNFFYVAFKGDKTFTFEAGGIDPFTQEQAEAMYLCVQ